MTGRLPTCAGRSRARSPGLAELGAEWTIRGYGHRRRRSAAFLAGAFVSLGIVAAALFVRKPIAPEISDASPAADAEVAAD